MQKSSSSGIEVLYAPFGTEVAGEIVQVFTDTFYSDVARTMPMGDYYLIFTKFGGLALGTWPNDNKITFQAYDGSLLVVSGIFDGDRTVNPFVVTGASGIFEGISTDLVICVDGTSVAFDFTNGDYCP